MMILFLIFPTVQHCIYRASSGRYHGLPSPVPRAMLKDGLLMQTRDLTVKLCHAHDGLWAGYLKPSRKAAGARKRSCRSYCRGAEWRVVACAEDSTFPWRLVDV